jgi:hypothetical protein
LFSERRAAVHEVCGEIIAGNPGLVEELLTALLEAKAEYRRWYRPEQSPVENYQRTAPLTSYVDEQLVQRYPGRFETIQQMYQPKIEAVEQEIGKLKGRTTG